MDSGRGADGTFSHQAAYYDGQTEYLSAVLPFLRDGAAAGQPVFAVVPPAAVRLLRTGLDGQAGDLTFADMAELGRNPGRIISAFWDFIGRHPGQPVRVLGEPFWPARSAAAAREAVRHEALINLAFLSTPVAVLCPYDVAALAPRITASAGRTHPVIRTPGGQQRSPDYAAGRVPRVAARPLSPPPARAAELSYSMDLRPVRGLVARHADRAGLNAERTGDLVLAVGEVAANTLRHASAPGTLHVWHSHAEIICQVTDQGRIGDPLVGRRRPPDATGLGLWVVHQVCDLVELRTGRGGTTVRMHMDLGGSGYVPDADAWSHPAGG